MKLFDTSAIKRIPAAKLREAASHAPLSMSPLSFYELLCHLDEPDPDGNFPKQKGHLLKCGIFDLLHDPFAQHAIDSGVQRLLNVTRLEDRLLIPEVLRILESSRSMEAFYSAEVALPEQPRRSLKGISANARSVLCAEEKSFVEVIVSLKAEIAVKFPDFPSQPISDEELAGMIGGKCVALSRGYAMDMGRGGDGPLNPVIASSYLYNGYLVCRAMSYLEKDKKGGSVAIIDPNDCEDAYISLHLNLLQGHTLVTGDNGTVQALDASLRVFPIIAAAGVTAKAQVLTIENFLSACG